MNTYINLLLKRKNPFPSKRHKKINMKLRLHEDGPRKRLGNPKNPKAHLQWKGGPCVDTYCACGASWHRCDTAFMYILRCPKCDRAYHVDDSVELVEMTTEEKADLDVFRDEIYKPRQENYVPWCSMKEDELEVYIDGKPGCHTCYFSYDDCECSCEDYDLIKELKEEICRLKQKLKKEG